MTRIIAIANQKGGVGKTTTTVNLGAAYAKLGKKVLLVDCDSQANMSEYLEFENDGKITITDLFMEVSESGKVSPEIVKSAIRHNKLNNVDYIPADINLANAEVFLLNALSRETILKRILKKDVTHEYDYVIIDCLPSLGVILINALSAATELLIPVQTQKFSMDGLDALIGVYEQIRDTINPDIKLTGIIATWVDSTNVSKVALENLRRLYIDKMMNTVIHKSVEAAKSSESHIPLPFYKNRLGKEYDNLAIELEESI